MCLFLEKLQWNSRETEEKEKPNQIRPLLGCSWPRVIMTGLISWDFSKVNINIPQEEKGPPVKPKLNMVVQDALFRPLLLCREPGEVVATALTASGREMRTLAGRVPEPVLSLCISQLPSAQNNESDIILRLSSSVLEPGDRPGRRHQARQTASLCCAVISQRVRPARLGTCFYHSEVKS